MTILTQVQLCRQPDVADDWLRFGEPQIERRLDRRRSVAGFAPGARFAYVRWRANDFGTVLWRLWVLRAPAAGEVAVTLAGVVPGGVVLLAVSGAQKVKSAFALIDAIEALGLQADEVPDHYWRMAHNRFAVHQTPRPYGPAERAAVTADLAMRS